MKVFSRNAVEVSKAMWGVGARSKTTTRNSRPAQDRSNMDPSHCTNLNLREKSDLGMPCYFFFLAWAASFLPKETAAEAPMAACSYQNQIHRVFFIVALWSCLEIAVG